jgi:hypothetical protein
MAMIERIDREISEVHKALATQLIRIAQIQQELDNLRARFTPERKAP